MSDLTDSVGPAQDPARDETDAVWERELRIAPVMTGGTSLAVWMGGVTAELYRLVASGGATDTPGGPPPPPSPAAPRRNRLAVDEIYRRLCTLTKTKPRIDVITGTSAGGLNGSLLAAAWMLRLSPTMFDEVRDVWLRAGDIAHLLRTPNESDPPSLLRGDERFTTPVQETLVRWDKAAERMGVVDAAQRRDVDLLVTVTTMDGEPVLSRDDFDQAIGDFQYAQSLRFRGEDFQTDLWPAKLATASRASASLPFVFEPTFLPVLSEEEDTGHKELNFANNASFTESRWAMDGGLLVNLPLGEAIDRIFDQPASGELRRVVLYIRPTPSVPSTTEKAQKSEVRGLSAAAQAAAAAVRAEGIVSDIRRIRRHNAGVRRQLATRSIMMRGFGDDRNIAREAVDHFDTYRELRVLASVESMLDDLHNRGASAANTHDGVDIDALASARGRLLPTRGRGLHAENHHWGWGISPLQHALAVLLRISDTLVRIMLDPTDDSRGAPTRRVAGQFREDLYTMLLGLTAIRQLDDAYWKYARLQPDTESRNWDEAFSSWPGVPREHELTRGHDRTYRHAMQEWRSIFGHSNDVRPTQGTVLADLERVGISLAKTTRWAHRELSADIESSISLSSDAPEAALALSLLEQFVTARVSGDDHAEGSAWAAGRPTPLETDATDEDPATLLVVKNLMALHVVDTVGPAEVLKNEQILDLMQVSWDATDELTGREPAKKLAGTELGRLGAFVKTSWRANDWFWGRMDSCERLTKLLLDPQRLKQLALTREQVVDALEPICRPVHLDASDSGESRFPRWERVKADIEAELAFLPSEAGDPASDELPQYLKHATSAVTRALQVELFATELPDLVEAIDETVERGGRQGDDGHFRRHAQRYLKHESRTPSSKQDAESLCRLLDKMRIGSESAGTELKGDLLTRTLTGATAVAVNALSSEHAGSFLPRVFRPLRSPASVVNAFVRTATNQSRAATALTMLVLVLSASFAGMSLVGAAVPAPIAFVSWLVFSATILIHLARAGIWAAIPVTALLLGSGVALVGNEARAVITCSEASCSEIAAWKRVGFVEPWAVGFWLAVALSLHWVAAIWSDGVGLRRRRAKLMKDPASGTTSTQSRILVFRQERRRMAFRVAVAVTVISLLLFNLSWVAARVLTGEDIGARSRIAAAAEWADDQRALVVVGAFAGAALLASAMWRRTAGTLWSRLREWIDDEGWKFR